MQDLLLCKFCLKVPKYLRKHLKRACKKSASAEELDHDVMKAKDNRLKMAKSLSAVPYGSLNYQGSQFSEPQDFFVDFLERRGCIVTSKPSDRLPSEEENLSESESEAEGGPRRAHFAWLGVHNKNHLKSPVLLEFREYCKKHFGELTRELMIQNVARYLFYINPDGVTVEFVKELEKAKEFFHMFYTMKASECTIKKYISHLRNFITFVLSEDFPDDLDQDTRDAIDAFLLLLKEIQSNVNKKVARSRKRALEPDPVTPANYLKLLTVSKPYLSAIFKQAQSNKELRETDKTLACYYLVAVLTLKHLRKPSVAQKLQVKEWLQMKHIVTSDGRRVGVIKTRRDIILLEGEDEQNFRTYFEKIRPTQQVKDTRTVPEFFVSSKGLPLHNCHRTLERFNRRFHLTHVAWGTATTTFDNWAEENLSQEDYDLASAYVHFCERKGEPDWPSLAGGMLTLVALEGGTEEETCGSAVDKRRRRTTTTEEGDDSDEEQDDEEERDDEGQTEALKDFVFHRLLEKHPLGLNARAPSLTECKRVSKRFASFSMSKWRRSQYKLRALDAANYFRILPKRDTFDAYVRRQRWESNVPKLKDVQHVWKPPMSRKKRDDTDDLKALIGSQQWKGLIIMDNETSGGHTLMTTHAFKKGEVICDYHGALMGGKEAAAELKETLPANRCYMYFFRVKDKKMCIDARKTPCACHPDMNSTFGRMLNHSCKKDNVKPLVKFLEGSKTPTIFFVAKTDIGPGTELFLNYGIRKPQYNVDLSPPDT